MEELIEQKPQKKNNLVKIILGSVGIVILLTLFIILAVSSKHITCVTFLGNDIYITVENGIPQIDEIEESQLKRPGYKFISWYQDNKFMTEYTEGSEYTGKNLYAKYERVIYTIEYLEEDNSKIDSKDFNKDTSFVLGDGTIIKVWTPEKFCVKNQYMDNTKKYGELINSGRFDQDAATAYGIEVYNTETDHSTFLIISSLKESGFKGYNIFAKDSLGNLKDLNTKAEYNSEKNGCLVYKDIISDTDYVGIVLKPYFE